ncbi:hypothetical protein KJ885_01340, partial [Patescibacteria group bacterium]|nr:hypothetical protein [Patescibacteria group bacterium]
KRRAEMREMLKNMSAGRKILLWNAIVMIILYLAYTVTYMITGKVEVSAIIAVVVAAAAAFAVVAAFAVAVAAAAAAGFVVAFAVAVAYAAVVAQDSKISFWKLLFFCLPQTALVFLIFRYAPYASFAMLGIYGLAIAYLLAIEPKLIANLKANPPFVVECFNGPYRAFEKQRPIPGLRLWLYRKLVA